MKVWQVLLVGGALLVGVMVLMKAAAPKSTPVNSSFGAPNSAVNGLAAGIGGLLAGVASKPTSSGFGTTTYTTVVPNEGTYGTSVNDVVVGNTLIDPNTGKTLVYGTD